MKKWMKLLIIGFVVLGALTYLLVSSFSEHSMYYAEISELHSNQSKFVNKVVRVSGTVVAGTIEKTSKDLTFTMKDSVKNDIMKIKFSGVVPDAFTEEVTVIVEGIYKGPDTIFLAKSLLAKCPSRYEGLDPNEHKESVTIK